MRNRSAAILLLVASVLAGCGQGVKRNATAVTGGNPDRGASDIARYGCGSCHSIPGIKGAHGLVGPSLAGVGGRLYVAGSLPNEAGNLVHWIHDPHSVNEKTVMPNLGVTPQDATDIAAYSYPVK